MNCDSRQAAGDHGEGVDRLLAAIPGTSYAYRRGDEFSHGFRIGDSRQFRFDAGVLTEDIAPLRYRSSAASTTIAQNGEQVAQMAEQKRQALAAIAADVRSLEQLSRLSLIHI